MMSVVMSSISHSTVDCKSTTFWPQGPLWSKCFDHEGPCDQNVVLCNLLCYVKGWTSLLTCAAIALSLYNIEVDT